MVLSTGLFHIVTVFLISTVVSTTSSAYSNPPYPIYDTFDFEIPNDRSPMKGTQIFGILAMASSVDQSGTRKRVLRSIRYYNSVKPATWEYAKKDCERINGTLAYFESDMEAQAAKRLMGLKCCRALVYWVGGEYNDASSRKGQFIWTNNGDPFDESLRWEVSHPNLFTKDTRVAVSTSGDFQLQTRNGSESHKYICKTVFPYVLETSYLSAYPLKGAETKWETEGVSR